MKHTWNAFRMILVCWALLGALAMSVQAAPGDQPNPTDKFKNLEFREIGPATMGGRIDDFAVVESNPNIVYVGTASGGVWKTTNNGTTWESVFDKESVSTIGDIAIAPSDSSVVWVGTGEPNNRQSSSWGDGAYKSLDGGKIWKKTGLEATHHIGRIVIHPKNPEVVYVAALGHLWGPNPERGVYKTSDGGKTWSQVLKINDDNGGDTGRIGLDVYRKDSNIVYALIQHEKGGIYRSEDKGETWKKMSDTNPRPSYYSQVRIDPNNDLRVWALGAQMFYSEDGGKTFSTQRVRGIHGDYHAMWIDPADSNHMITGSDGGIHWSYDAGKTWDFLNTIAIGQFYEVALDNEKPYHICGGLQDNGSWCGPVQTLTRDGIVNEDWQVIHGGDGFYAAIDNVEPWIVYTESQDGFIDRRDLRTGQQRAIRPEAKAGEPHYRFQWNSPVAVSAHNHTTVYYGGNYLFKSTNRGDTWTRLGGDLTSGVDRNKLQIFGKTPDKNTLSRHDGVQEYPTITTLSESPLTPNVLWVGTDDGNVQVTRDGGKMWKNVASKVPGVPRGTYVSRVAASKTGEGAALLAFDGHRGDDNSVYVFTTSDYGETWKSIRSGIPDSAGSVHVVREHPRNQNLLFAGLEFGLWVSWDRGANWTALKNNFPTVPVDDIELQARENDLVLATHGRSIWIFDDLTPLEKMDATVAASELTLFPPRTANAWHIYTRRWSAGQKAFAAKNPPAGAVINYYLKSAVPPSEPKPDSAEKKETTVESQKPKTDEPDARPAAKLTQNPVETPAAQAAEKSEEKKEEKQEVKKEGKVKIVVTDKDGKMIRELEAPGSAGVNRTNWDLRYNPPAEPTPEQLDAIAAGYGFGPRGPYAEPGEYQIKITAGDKLATQKVTVEDDPRLQLSVE